MGADRETLEEFYRYKFGRIPEGILQQSGHFNVFDIADIIGQGKPAPYPRRDFYKVGLVRGNMVFHCGDKSMKLNGTVLMFLPPDLLYRFELGSDTLSGYYCIFKEGFFSEHLRVSPLGLPLFASDARAAYLLNQQEEQLIEDLFIKISREITSDYPYKYDLIRSYLIELIHQVMKWQPSDKLYVNTNANARITALFRDLLERQFPINSNTQQLELRTATQFADQLHVHINHLNRSVKATTGKTTTMLIMDRLLNEAKALLTYTDWSVADIAYCLGFEEIANFNHFFKKHTTCTPGSYRQQAINGK